MVDCVSRTVENASRTSGSSGPPLRAFAMVLISLAILFAGLGLAGFGGDDDESPIPPTSEAAAAPSTSAAAPSGGGVFGNAASPSPATDARTPSPAAQSATSGSAPTSALLESAPASAAPVRVFNNSNVAGLAAQTASLLEDEGFTVAETGNYSDGLLAQTAVYYGTGAGERETAMAVADALGVSAQPRFAGIEDSSPGVIVIVTEQ
ncbi:LytR C-terminal domain-containing protein [Rhodococcus chondri]|uniref:LytR C-terminal domain-containing protein n=1 Tax=Rhodococcus chondri TaxID=3065941 RepID=A0ABU7JLU7_9NOCA|nr:LytR C-terminal domain-containing protein [Rhodococcus sp. CC-R104]MEE2031016.1 LytR C-terminal domain-containing protein [Rhodococcus sp. CC-R104]